MLAGYDLPEDPQVPGTFFTGMSALRKVGAASMWAGLLGVGLFFLRTGRRRPPPEDRAIADAIARGRETDERPTSGTTEGPPPVVDDTRAGGDRGGERAVGAPSEDGEIQRYTLFDRILHWLIALTFIYLLLSGLALGYPRMAWLYDVLGGGQTVRWLHPVIGAVMTVAVLVMFFAWVRDMVFDRTDRRWLRSLREYVRTGHSGVDVGRFNAGQKGYFWFAVLTTILLLITGIPLWFPDSFAAGLLRASRFAHHVVFLAAVAGFIVHVYMSTVMLPGTMSSMTSGNVTRRWAAFHHPAWFRRTTRASEPSGEST
jgi:formate dehydrogenase subunit gamma